MPWTPWIRIHIVVTQLDVLVCCSDVAPDVTISSNVAPDVHISYYRILAAVGMGLLGRTAGSQTIQPWRCRISCALMWNAVISGLEPPVGPVVSRGISVIVRCSKGFSSGVNVCPSAWAYRV